MPDRTRPSDAPEPPELGPGAEIELLGHPLGQGPARQEAELGIEIGPQVVAPIVGARR